MKVRTTVCVDCTDRLGDKFAKPKLSTFMNKPFTMGGDMLKMTAICRFVKESE